MNTAAIAPRPSPTPARHSTPGAGSKRLNSVDMLRGLVIVIMTLDHVRDYFTSARFDATDLTPDYSCAVSHPLDHPFLRTHLRAARGDQRLARGPSAEPR